MLEPLALMGGTFDPVHHGHLITARAVAEQQGYRRVVLVPAATPPHKQAAPSSSDDRLAMLRLAVEGDPLFEISTIELDRGGPSYTLDTLRRLRAVHGQAVPLHWIIGADMLEMLPTWHCAGELLETAQLVVAYRPPWTAGQLEQVFVRLAEQLPPPRVREIRRHVAATPQIEISSSDIRRRVADGRSIRNLVPPPVEQYILDHVLYRPGG